ncbi:hypothetical protein HDU86_001278 [Geranomyces michiganensis]|nr:hypothetical protein HDU86_001278 [Geranomyces michiganensis]
MTLESNLDQDFETGLQLAREAFQKKIAAKDEELKQLLFEIATKDKEIKDLNARLDKINHQYSQARSRMADMSAAITKLATFKENVIASLREEPELEDVSDTEQLSGPARRDSSVSRESSTLRRSTLREPGDEEVRNESLNRSRTMEETCSVSIVIFALLTIGCE